MMRNRFDKQLELLSVELIKMGSLCELAISGAIKGLFENDEKMLNLVMDTDREIDEKEREIENLCFKLLLQQQPVARDLRGISAALKMISDMERIGDQASDIAEIAVFIKGSGADSHPLIRHMADTASMMVANSIKSYVDRDLQLAYEVMKKDDMVDEYFDKIKNDLIDMIRKESTEPKLCLDLLMIAKYMERIADHAVNIAEWVEFSITGEHVSEELRER